MGFILSSPLDIVASNGSLKGKDDAGRTSILGIESWELELGGWSLS